MPMSQPGGGGGGSILTLSDVSIIAEDNGLDAAVLQYSNIAGKWIARSQLNAGSVISTLNAADKSAGVTLSNGNLTASLTTNAFQGVRGNRAHQYGKYYFEFVATTIGSTAAYGVGCANSALTLGSWNAVTFNTFYYLPNGNLYHNEINTAIATYAAGNTVGIAVDFDNQNVWGRVNGGNWNNNAANNPSTNTGGLSISSNLGAKSFFPFFGAEFINDAGTINTGATMFQTNAPAGFSAWDIFAPNPLNVAASPVTFTAPLNGAFHVAGGTVSSITLSRAGLPAITMGANAGFISVMQGDVVTITDTASPTVTFIPSY